LLDAVDGGNPLRAMVTDVHIGLATLDYLVGLATEVKGETVPLGDEALDYTIREPLGVVARIIPFNHPVMFLLMKMGAPLVTGNTLVFKPAEQTSLSALRLAELVGEILPAGVFNVVTGNRQAGAALVRHPLVAKVGLMGSVPTGGAALRAAAETIMRVDLELGGKNALIGYHAADPDAVAAAAVHGMNLRLAHRDRCREGSSRRSASAGCWPAWPTTALRPPSSSPGIPPWCIPGRSKPS
jgi:betaine-aldehyde dehydrogenase